MTPRFRPQLDTLESRETPTVNVLYTGASLTLSGTPQAAPTSSLRIAGDGSNNFTVTDGSLSLGTYHVTQNLSVKLASFDTNVFIVPAGDSLRGNILVDVGAGDTDPSFLHSQVVLGNRSGAARVGGDVTFKGGSGEERWRLAVSPGATLDVGGGVKVQGTPVTTPVEDYFTLDKGVKVHGGVLTSRITYTTIQGTIDGDLTANTIDSPGGMGFLVDTTGVVHGDVTATGGVTAPDAASYYSYARMWGTTDGDVRFNLTGGQARASVLGTVGGDWTVRHSGGGYVTVTLSGDAPAEVKGDLSIVTADDAAATDETVVFVDGVVRGDFRFKETGQGGAAVVLIDGYVAGDANIDAGGPGIRYAEVGLLGAVGGSANVTGQGKAVNVVVNGFPGYDDYFGVPGLKTVTGDLTIRLGDGANSLDIVQFDPAAKTIGGKLTYKGGSGTDAVSIAGQYTFKAKLDLGGGDGSVSMAPDATLGGLDLDFGKLPGTKTWNPPTVITFPVKIKNLS